MKLSNCFGCGRKPTYLWHTDPFFDQCLYRCLTPGCEVHLHGGIERSEEEAAAAWELTVDEYKKEAAK